MNKLFQNKVVLITGASSGIGKSLACEFAEKGANVILLARRFELISSLSNKLSKDFNKCIAIKCDVSNDGEIENAVKKGLKYFKKIDIVIANAGFEIPGNFEDIKLEDYKKLFETNVFGVLRTIYACLEELKKTKGSICIIGSISGYLPFPSGSSTYIMSKFAIRSFAESLNLELSPYNISVTHIMPGFIKTEFNDQNGDFIKKINWLQMEPEKAAKKIASAIKNKRREIVLTIHGKILMYIQYLAPFLLRKLSKKFVKIKK
jgi:short-subunit dehydrogenase